jgi:hypothetical protein
VHYLIRRLCTYSSKNKHVGQGNVVQLRRRVATAVGRRIVIAVMRAMFVDEVEINQRENSRCSDLAEAEEKDETLHNHVFLSARKAFYFL